MIDFKKMFNKSLVSENIRIFKGEWPFKMEYSNYLLNGHAAELLCGVKERDFDKTTYYQIDWKKLNFDHCYFIGWLVVSEII